MKDEMGSTGVEIDVMITAELPTPHAYVYRAEFPSRIAQLAAVVRPGAQRLRLPCLAFALRHPAAGTILIDTGMHPEAARDLRRDFGAPMALMFRSMRPAAEPFDEQLRALGIEAGGVERVIMTHLHVDHTSGMRLLPQAKFVCARPEWDAARTRFAAGKGYVHHHLPEPSRMQLLDFDRDGEPHGPFAQTVDLLGDGTVRLVFTPGHTVGHLSVLLRLLGNRQVLVIGDAAYTLRNIHEEILPMLTADDDWSLRSMREIKAFAEGHPDAILVPSHDPSAWHELREVTDSAERALAAAS